VLFFLINLALVLYLVLTKRLFGVRGGKKAYEARLRSESIMDAVLARAAAAVPPIAVPPIAAPPIAATPAPAPPSDRPPTGPPPASADAGQVASQRTQTPDQ
jgi:hypothetical protein